MSKDKTHVPESAEAAGDLPTKSSESGDAALEQASIYGGLMAPITLTFDDGTTMKIPPNPYFRILPGDRLAAWDKLQHARRKLYDRGREIVNVIEAQEVKDKHGNVITTIEATTETTPGPLIVPYQIDGELVTPPWEIQEVIAALGQEKYELFLTKQIDGEPADWLHLRNVWTQVETRLKERQAEDPKSTGGAVDLAAVPEADSE